ncbi:hypothetical protein [Psychrobacter sanguinis]|uniref:hypothetical protein n=1 Tax=Psychrobacter sanguinis TaxID=861445 RepID=UPI003879BDF2
MSIGWSAMGDALVAQLFGAVQLSDVGIVLGVLLLTSIAIISLYLKHKTFK